MSKLSTLELLDGIECTGCLCCYNKCYSGAIDITTNKEGFSFPEIDPLKCIGCNSCVKSCPERNKIELTTSLSCYSCFAKDKYYVMSGSSGGVIPLIADYVLKNAGIVYGAVFDEKTRSVVHSSSNQVNIEKIFRSKYVQSDVGYCYRNIKQLLDEEKNVLFVGTPCQVAGLIAFLSKDYDNLITVDFVCHGVPSPGVFKNIISNYEKKNNKKIIDVTFREKEYGWIKQTIKLYFEDNIVKQIQSKKCIFYNLFVFDYILRKSCYSCNRQVCHMSDITVADDWTSRDNEYGVSRVLINNEKGVKVFNTISELLNYRKINNINNALPHNYRILRRTMFFKVYNIKKTNSFLFFVTMVECKIIRIIKRVTLFMK